MLFGFTKPANVNLLGPVFRGELNIPGLSCQCLTFYLNKMLYPALSIVYVQRTGLCRAKRCVCAFCSLGGTAVASEKVDFKT